MKTFARAKIAYKNVLKCVVHVDGCGDTHSVLVNNFCGRQQQRRESGRGAAVRNCITEQKGKTVVVVDGGWSRNFLK